MIFVGTFNEQQLVAKEDRKAVEKMKELHPDHKYVGSKIMKGGKLRVWVATLEEYMNNNWM